MPYVTQDILVSRERVTSGSMYSKSTYKKTATQEVIAHKVTDNGSGGLGDFGTVNYAGKSINVRLVNKTLTAEGYKTDYEDAEKFENILTSTGDSGGSAKKGGTYGDSDVSEELLAATTLNVSYSVGFGSDVEHTSSFAPGAVSIDLCPNTNDYVVPNSVMFTWMGHIFTDHDGVLYRDRTTPGTGFKAGKVNYSLGTATVTDYVVSGPATDFTLNSLWTIRQKWNTASIFMRTTAAPVKPTGFVMNLSDSQGNAITAQGDGDGNITGTHLRGRIEYLTGIVELQFGDYVLDTSLSDAQKGEWWYDEADVGVVIADKIWKPWIVDPTTLRYNSVSFFYLPIDADILGLDPVRLPPDGRVPIFRVGTYVVLSHSANTTPATVANGNTIDCGRDRLSRMRLLGHNGLVINTGYTRDLEAGTLSVVDITGWSQPVHVEHTIEDMARVIDVQIDGTISLNRELSHVYPVGSVLSSAMMAQDMKARMSLSFDQETWGNVWSDSLIGDTADGTYNIADNPIVVTNRGSLPQRWALVFTSSTSFNIIGENVGVIGTGNTGADCSPINPRTGTPYFTVLQTGWGAGWDIGNVFRFNIVGAMYPLACIRTIQPGPDAGIEYNFGLLQRGDIDRP